MNSVRIGADIGGTFTDLVVLGEDGQVLVTKVPSTPENYSQGVVDALSSAVATLGLKSEDISEVSHGFTVASNAILERKGERTALITTEGFRDVLEFAHLDSTICTIESRFPWSSGDSVSKSGRESIFGERQSSPSKCPT